MPATSVVAAETRVRWGFGSGGSADLDCAANESNVKRGLPRRWPQLTQ